MDRKRIGHRKQDLIKNIYNTRNPLKSLKLIDFLFSRSAIRFADFGVLHYVSRSLSGIVRIKMQYKHQVKQIISI